MVQCAKAPSLIDVLLSRKAHLTTAARGSSAGVPRRSGQCFYPAMTGPYLCTQEWSSTAILSPPKPFQRVYRRCGFPSQVGWSCPESSSQTNGPKKTGEKRPKAAPGIFKESELRKRTTGTTDLQDNETRNLQTLKHTPRAGDSGSPAGQHPDT